MKQIQQLNETVMEKEKVIDSLKKRLEILNQDSKIMFQLMNRISTCRGQRNGD
jgi:hypothetical protein